MNDLYINHLAVFVCAILSLVIGSLWWSPLLFAKPWQAENGFTDEQAAKMNPVKTFGLTLILAWVMSYNLAFFLAGAATDWKWGLTAGLLTGVGWVSAMFVVVALFEQRSIRYIAINCGYMIVYFAIIGLIIGAWR